MMNEVLCLDTSKPNDVKQFLKQLEKLSDLKAHLSARGGCVFMKDHTQKDLRPLLGELFLPMGAEASPAAMAPKDFANKLKEECLSRTKTCYADFDALAKDISSWLTHQADGNAIYLHDRYLAKAILSNEPRDGDGLKRLKEFLILHQVHLLVDLSVWRKESPEVNREQLMAALEPFVDGNRDRLMIYDHGRERGIGHARWMLCGKFAAQVDYGFLPVRGKTLSTMPMPPAVVGELHNFVKDARRNAERWLEPSNGGPTT